MSVDNLTKCLILEEIHKYVTLHSWNMERKQTSEDKQYTNSKSGRTFIWEKNNSYLLCVSYLVEK